MENQPLPGLNSEHLEIIKKELEKGPILVEYYRPHSAGGPDYHTFRDFNLFQESIPSTKFWGGAEHYVIWTLPELLEKKLELAQANYASKSDENPFLLSSEHLQAIQDFLNKDHNEILFCGFDNESSETIVTDRDGFGYVSELLERYNKSDSEIYVFPYNFLDRGEHAVLKAMSEPKAY
jgi:hypothetical protein